MPAGAAGRVLALRMCCLRRCGTRLTLVEHGVHRAALLFDVRVSAQLDEGCRVSVDGSRPDHDTGAGFVTVHPQGSDRWPQRRRRRRPRRESCCRAEPLVRSTPSREGHVATPLAGSCHERRHRCRVVLVDGHATPDLGGTGGPRTANQLATSSRWCHGPRSAQRPGTAPTRRRAGRRATRHVRHLWRQRQRRCHWSR